MVAGQVNIDHCLVGSIFFSQEIKVSSWEDLVNDIIGAGTEHVPSFVQDTWVMLLLFF
jgi:hypothetical protein